jgi:hypothetical protein
VVSMNQRDSERRREEQRPANPPVDAPMIRLSKMFHPKRPTDSSGKCSKRRSSGHSTKLLKEQCALPIRAGTHRYHAPVMLSSSAPSSCASQLKLAYGMHEGKPR